LTALEKLEAQILARFEAKLFQYAPGHPWHIKLQSGGVRHTFSTHKTTRSEAAIVAKEIHKFLTEQKDPKDETKAMAKTIAEYDPEPKAGAVVTIGDLIKKAEKVWLGVPRTFQDYGTSLRRVIGEVRGVDRDEADNVKIADITRDEIELWRSTYIKAAGSSHAKKAAAQTTSNSILRGCKALFGQKLLEKLQLEDLHNPFQKVRLPNNRDHRFQSGGVVASELLAKAVAELADTDLEVFKAIVLALTLGLRRNEIDKIEYSAFNLDQRTVSIDDSEHLHVKSDRSRGVVELEPELIPLIRGWQAGATSSFVLESAIKPRPESRYHHYRAERTFERAVKWLRKSGVKSNEPLHFCRKLYGSLINDRHGIYAASRALRHADISVTTRHYTSRTENVLPGLGGVLSAAEKVVPMKRAEKIA
jgi:integrase